MKKQLTLSQMNKGQTVAFQDLELYNNHPAPISSTMPRGRPRIYKTPEDKARANREKSKRSYHK